MCDEDDEPVFQIKVREGGLPRELQMLYGEREHLNAIRAAAEEALKLLEAGATSMAERTLRLALKGGHPRQG